MPCSPSSDTVSNRALPSQRQGPSSHREGPLPSPTPREPIATPEHINPSFGTHESSGTQSLQTDNPLPSPSHVNSLPPKLPPRPWPSAPLAPGVDPKAPRMANKVYDTIVAGMLTEAQHKFECLLFVEDAYPGIDTQIRWSLTCWEETCVDAKRYFELSREMMNLVSDCIAIHQIVSRDTEYGRQIKSRCSHGRGLVLSRIRSDIDSLFDMNTKRKSVVHKNSRIANNLLENNTFYFVVCVSIAPTKITPGLT